MGKSKEFKALEDFKARYQKYVDDRAKTRQSKVDAIAQLEEEKQRLMQGVNKAVDDNDVEAHGEYMKQLWTNSNSRQVAESLLEKLNGKISLEEYKNTLDDYNRLMEEAQNELCSRVEATLQDYKKLHEEQKALYRLNDELVPLLYKDYAEYQGGLDERGTFMMQDPYYRFKTSVPSAARQYIDSL